MKRHNQLLRSTDTLAHDGNGRSPERRSSFVGIAINGSSPTHRSSTKSNQGYARSLTPRNSTAGDFFFRNGASAGAGAGVGVVARTGRSMSCVSVVADGGRQPHQQTIPAPRTHPFGANNESNETQQQQYQDQRRQSQQQQQQQQQQQEQRRLSQQLELDEIYDQIYKAKAQAQTVSTVNGCLYIDYKYIGQLPQGFHL